MNRPNGLSSIVIVCVCRVLGSALRARLQNLTSDTQSTRNSRRHCMVESASPTFPRSHLQIRGRGRTCSTLARYQCTE